VIVTSTVATLGETELPFLLTETNSQNPSKLSCTYEKTKLEAEYAALTAAKNGQEIIILKPGRIIGPSDGKAPSTRWIVHYLNGNLPFYIDGGVSFCDVRDVARAHVRALTQGKSGETYLLGGHNRIMSQFFADLQARTGKGPIKPLPRFLAYGLGCISELTANFYPHSLEELSRASVIKSAGYTFIDSFKAQEELGYAIRSYDETLRDTLKSLLSQSEYADVFEISEEAYS
jgi:dihydroflavonol-4-reductase